MSAVLYVLILAHLLGDFVFQSNDLIQRKYKSWLGTFEHVCIITFFVVLFLFPYWNSAQTWFAAAVVFSTHFFQDLLKIKYDITFNTQKRSTVPFFADQFLHIGVIFLLSGTFKGLEPMPLPEWVDTLYFSQLLTIYLLGLVLFAFVYDITRFQFERKKNKKTLKYIPDTKGMRSRVMWYSMAYVLLLLVNGSFM